MKGFLVVDKINDVHFVDADNEFKDHINCQAVENGLLQPEESCRPDLDPDIIMQLFSPLFMSQWFLIEQRKNPCTSITCENGFIFTFKQYEDLLVIAINGDGEEDEHLLHKKISIFIKMSEFSFGPVVDEIGRCRFSHKSERWNFLKGVLSAWSILRNEEHSFLVEAIERLHVNQHMNEKCIEVLENAVSRFQAAGERCTQHALLIVNNKLLSLFSNRSAPALKESDILCIILLVKLLFPTNEKLEDLFSSSVKKSSGLIDDRISTPASVSVTPPSTDKYESAIEGDDSMDDADDQYMSATDTPITRKTENPYPAVSEQTIEEEEGYQTCDPMTPYSVSQEETERTKKQSKGRSRSRTLEDVHIKKVKSGKVTPGTGRARSRSLNDPGVAIEDLESQDTQSSSFFSIESDQVAPVPSTTPDHLQQTVFLSTDICQFSPYQLHFIQVFPGMVLLVLSEFPRSIHANSLCQLLRLLKDLLSGHKDQVQRAQGHLLYDIINVILNKLAVAMKKARGNLETILEDIRRRWDNPDFKSSLLMYLEQGTGTDIPPGTERSLTGLHKKVKELFLYLYLYPIDMPAHMAKVVKMIQERSKAKLWDYKDYLSVKAQRNIVMTSYLDALPGLIHFIYVDRKTNQLTAPSLNISSKDDLIGVDPTQLMKNKVKTAIWKVTNWMYSKLASGITMVTAREGDFHFSYFLWFEDFQGHQVSVQQSYQSGDVLLQPGIMSGNFYKALQRHCFPNVIPGSINCYELVMMHIGLVHTQYIASHCRKLASMLYEASDSTTFFR